MSQQEETHSPAHTFDIPEQHAHAPAVPPRYYLRAGDEAHTVAGCVDLVERGAIDNGDGPEDMTLASFYDGDATESDLASFVCDLLNAGAAVADATRAGDGPPVPSPATITYHGSATSVPPGTMFEGRNEAYPELSGALPPTATSEGYLEQAMREAGEQLLASIRNMQPVMLYEGGRMMGRSEAARSRPYSEQEHDGHVEDVLPLRGAGFDEDEDEDDEDTDDWDDEDDEDESVQEAGKPPGDFLVPVALDPRTCDHQWREMGRDAAKVWHCTHCETGYLEVKQPTHFLRGEAFQTIEPDEYTLLLERTLAQYRAYRAAGQPFGEGEAAFARWITERGEQFGSQPEPRMSKLANSAEGHARYETLEIDTETGTQTWRKVADIPLSLSFGPASLPPVGPASLPPVGPASLPTIGPMPWDGNLRNGKQESIPPWHRPITDEEREQHEREDVPWE